MAVAAMIPPRLMPVMPIRSRVDLRPRGQQIDGAPHVFAGLGDGAGEPFRVVGDGLRPARQSPLAVVGQLERKGRNRPRRQHGANQIGQRLVAVENVHADHRRIAPAGETTPLGR